MYISIKTLTFLFDRNLLLLRKFLVQGKILLFTYIEETIITLKVLYRTTCYEGIEVLKN